MTRKSLLLGLMWTLAALTQLSAQCDCVTTGNCPVPINDNGIYNGTLDVTVNGANDLGQNPLTSVCVTIAHTWIGDLSVSLTSPSGLHYLVMADAGNNYGNCGTQQDNAEVCIVLGTGNALTNNTEYQCNAAPCSVGTCCLTGNNWTMPCGGVIDPITGAVQAPNCNLNDFNVAGQPANGTWTLSVSDVCNMDVGVLQNFSLTFANGIQSCIVCEADAGELDSLEIITCLGDSSLLLDLPPDYGGGSGPDTNAYSYAYIISQNGIILSIDSVADLTSQPPGVYGVYGFSYLNTDSLDLASLIGLDTALAISQLESSTSPFCGDFSTNAIPVTIVPDIPVTVINTSVCQGDCITVGGQPVCSSGTVTLASWLGCDSVVQVNLTTIPPDTVAYAATVCAGNCVTIGGQSYCPPGQFFVHLQTWQGCDSVVHLTFNELSPTAIINPASPPALTCTTTSLVLDASSSGPGPLTYSWSGPGSFSSTQSAIIATTAGTYTVTVSNNTLSPACTSTASVTVANGVVPPDLVVSGPAPAICLGATFDLATASVVDVNNTNSNITVHSGTPATAANQLSNLLVSPSATTTYYFKATKGICSDETSLVLTVTPVPTGDFSATSAICTGTSATVNYTGTGTAGATYNWNFGGGTATPGTGPGPHTVTWPSTGVKLVTLTVVENNCASIVFSQTVSVESPLLTPNISCSTTTSSVLFSWSNVPGNAGYNVTVLTGQPGSQQTSNSYLVSNLNSGDVVTIQVVAIGTGACGSSMAQQTCAAADCPPGTVDMAPVSDICADASMAAFNLQATMTGGSAGGTLTWSGTGITNPATGTFDPNQANPGANTITATYQNGNCGYTNNLVINVFQTPSANFTVQSPVCAGDASAIVFTGTTGPGSIFTWDFDGGTATPGTGQGPQSVVWPMSGTYTVSLTVENADGCVSAPVSATVQVDAPLATPVINCSSTTESVTFSWGAVPGATGFGVNVLSGQTATQISPTSYEVTNLQPGEQVTIEVTALSGNACGNTTSSQTCAAMDCPTVTIAIDPVADICRDASTQPVQLVANITGGTGNGTLTWTGSAVSMAGVFDPSQATIGLNTVTATYQESNCLSTEDLEIYVYQTPVASFTAPASACAGTAVTINYNGTVQPGLTYAWDFGGGTASPGSGPGPHSVTWATGGQQVVTLTVSSPNGCVSSMFSSPVQVDLPLSAPLITCNNTTTSIEFTWPGVPGASAYNVTVNSGQSGTQTSPTTYLVTGLQPDEQVCVTVTASANGACPAASAQVCCNAESCPTLTVNVASVADFCLGGAASPVQLTATVTGSDGTGTGTWSGPGVGGSTFDPAQAGPGQHTVVYSFDEATCTYSDAIVIGVYQQPTADFTLDDLICVTDFATIGFTGVAGANAVFTWNFDGGTASPGIGPGPHQVEWDTPGPKTVTLGVTQDGCSSGNFTQQIQVDEELATPVINCSATTASVDFTWNDVPNATGYTVAVLNGPAGTQTSPTSYNFTNLNPGQQVVIQMTVNGNTVCPPPVVTATCNALPCPNFTVAIDPVAPMCLTGNNAVVDLVGDVDGVGQSGFGTWSGTGIVDTVQGIFDPAVAGVGAHKITFTYQQGNCFYEDETDIEITAPPVADAGQDAALTCWETEQTAILGGPGTTLGAGIGYLWNATGGSFPGDATALHPEVTVPGTYTLTATNTALGCSDSDEVTVTSTQSTPVPEFEIVPLNCHGEKDGHMTITNVSGGVEPYLFSLNGEPFVAGTTFPFLAVGEYELTVIDAQGCDNSVTFRIDDPGDLSIELTANLGSENIIEYGDSVQLNTTVSLPESDLDSIAWTNSGVLSCGDCLDPVATPVTQTTFRITVFVNGCEASDSLTIFVENNNQVYAPTAFSPSGDAVNDLFRLYSGPTVVRIKTFYVFDRWGEMVYRYQDFDTSDPSIGWDGTFDGKPMDPALFVWFAEVEFIDGSVKVLEGEVSLIR